MTDSVSRMAALDIDPAKVTLRDLRGLFGGPGDTAATRSPRNAVTVHWFTGLGRWLHWPDSCQRAPASSFFADVRLIKATFVMVPSNAALTDSATPWIVQLADADPRVPAAIAGIRLGDSLNAVREHAARLKGTFDSMQAGIRISPGLWVKWLTHEGRITRLWSDFGTWHVSP